MERRAAVLVAVMAALLASVTTAIAMRVTDDDARWFGHRDGIMSSRYDDSRSPRWSGLDRMMPGGKNAIRVASEYAYLAEMIAHHEEAVAAAVHLQRSNRAEMRDFGKAIIASQSAQIDRMLAWLAEWYPNRSGEVVYQPMMRDLTDLSEDRLDRVFLQDMVRHHMGAVMMSQQLLVRGVIDHEQVGALARTIRDEQHAEIIQMRQWLWQWFAVDWRHGMWW